MGVYVCDRDGKIVSHNRRATRLWQRQPELHSATDRYCGSYRLYRADGSPVAHEQSPMAFVLSDGRRVTDGEIVMERPDGTRILVSIDIEPLRDEAGHVIGAVNCFREVSASDRVGPPALESERQAGDLLDALAVAVYTTDQDGRITFYNEAAADLWGVRPELGRSEFCGAWKLYTPDGVPLPHHESPMAIALRERRPVRHAEAIAERPDGTRVAFMPFPTPLYDRHDNFVGAINLLVDITEHKRTHESLARWAREQAALYRFTDRLYRARSLGAAYEAALDAIRDALNCPHAAILLLDDDETMRSVGWRGISDRLRGAMERYSPWRPEEQDARPITIEDVDAAETLGALGTVLLDEKIRSVGFFPVSTDGRLVGLLAIYFEVPRGLGERESDVAVTIARQLGFSVAMSRAGEARRQSQQVSRLLAAVVDSSGDAIVTKDLQGIITSWNTGAERLFGYSEADVIGKPVTILMPPDRQAEEPIILDRIRSGQRIEHYETIRRRKDGNLIDISLTVSPVRDAEGKIIGASKIARDITERRRAQEQQKLLFREMDHRIKNLFTLASSIVGLSLRSADSAQSLASSVQNRLDALARAHSLTMANPFRSPSDAARVLTLHSLVATVVAPYEGQQSRVIVNGEDHLLAGETATSLALLFNEFATNAAKYGSLSTPDGFVVVTCSRFDDKIQIVWTERGGPPVSEPRAWEGFGSVLAEGTVKRQLDGDISREWHPDGLVIRVTVPSERFSA